MKKTILTAVLTLGAIFTGVAQKRVENKLSVVVVTTSYHFTSERFNQCNTGIGLEYRWSPILYAGAGVYRNSMDCTSIYTGIGIETNAKKHIGVGVMGGIISGYQSPGYFAPIMMPYLRFGRQDRINAKINIMPPLKEITPAVAALQIRVPVNVFKKDAPKF